MRCENANGNVGNGRQDSEMRDRYVEAPPLGRSVYGGMGRRSRVENTTRFC